MLLIYKNSYLNPIICKMITKVNFMVTVVKNSTHIHHFFNIFRLCISCTIKWSYPNNHFLRSVLLRYVNIQIIFPMDPTKYFCIFVFNFLFINNCILPSFTFIKWDLNFNNSCSVTAITHSYSLYCDNRITFWYPNYLIS